MRAFALMVRWRAAAMPSIGLVMHGSKFCAGVVARMEPPGPASGRPDDKLRVIRGQPIPDYAAPHPGYKAAAEPNAMLIFERNVAASKREPVAVGELSECN